ncbi:redoxin domain-containing protein [Niabella sp. CJ426]|uniref:redoxin domain-containing protein n=1 Tax=Niabella sp. CJ426 TaxID=3393740 RepID=UPI003D07335C
MKAVLFIFFLIGASLTNYSQTIQFSHDRWKTIDSKKLHLKETNHLKLFIFLSPECPLSQKYVFSLNQIYKLYKKQVYFIGVFPGKGYKNKYYRAFKTKYNIQFNLINDPQMKLVSALNASKTPEVFLLDSANKILYQGAIDDWAISLGKNKLQPTKNYLQDAISNSIRGSLINPKFVEAVGCYIENEN